MAIAIGSNSSSFTKSASGVTSLTFAYDCGSASNRYLVVFVGDVSGDSVTGVTYNGVSMTQLGKANRGPSDTTTLEGYIYGLHAPATGSNNVVITRSSTTNWIEGGAILLTDAKQETAASAGTFFSGDATGGSKNKDITTVEANTAVVGFIANDNGATAMSTGGTSLFIGDAGGFGDAFRVFQSSTFPVAAIGAYNVAWTQNSAGSWWFMAVSIAPAPAAATSFPDLRLAFI